MDIKHTFLGIQSALPDKQVHQLDGWVIDLNVITLTLPTQ